MYFFQGLVQPLFLASQCLAVAVQSSTAPLQVNIDWNDIVIRSKTTTTLQSVAVPPLLAGSNQTIRENALKALFSVKADYVRYVPWFPYPRIAVPEIEAPSISGNSCRTSWDFTYADQLLLDFFRSTPGVSHIINFSTTPGWMWVSNEPYTYPEDVTIEDWSYNEGTALKDPSGKQLTDYYRRLLSWYVQGGFTDECGVYHHSGHHLNIEYWEIFNEVRAEHSMSVGLYNMLYDSVTEAIHEVSPQTQFIGFAYDQRDPVYLEGFLNPANHKQGTPLDWISYHFYASGQGNVDQQATGSFQNADAFFEEVVKMEEVRKRVSPHTKTTIDEIGTFANNGIESSQEYWVWSGGVFAYIFSKLAAMGIDVLGESQLVAIPTNNPSVSMVDWTTGMPNARLRVLELLQSSFQPGDLMLNTTLATEGDKEKFHAQAFKTADGLSGRVLLINKQNVTHTVALQQMNRGFTRTVDVQTGGAQWRTGAFIGGNVTLSPYAVMVAISL